MATRRAAMNSRVETLGEMSTDNRVAALIPVNARGETVNVEGEDWRMPAGPEADDPGAEHSSEMLIQSPADRVLSMLSDLGEQDERAYVKVSRVKKDEGGKLIWCKDYSVAAFEAGGYEMVRTHWGPGEYQVILYGTIPGTKRFTIRTRATVELGEQIAGAAPAPSAAPQSELGQLVQQLAANQQEMMRVLTERPNPMSQMTEMFTMMKLMREAMGEPSKPANGLGDIVNAIKQLREVNEEINPSREPESPMGMVTKMLPLIQAGLQQRQATPAPVAPVSIQQPRLPHPPGIHAPPITITPPAPNLTQETEAMNLAEIVKQKGYLATLVQMGKDSMPEAEAAKFVYDNLSDDLIDALAKPEWWDLFKAIAPGDIEPQKAWFTTVRDSALSMFDEPEVDEAAPASDAG